MPVSLPLFAFKLVSDTNVLHTARTDNPKWWHDHIDYISGKISKSLNIKLQNLKVMLQNGHY